MATDLVGMTCEELFDPDLMGSLPDACVPHTSVKDWQDLLDLVVARGWRFEYSEAGTVSSSAASSGLSGGTWVNRC